MRPEHAKKLLGGYATGTLTDAEQSALFAAALEDQELFDALAREQALREVLRDPAVKAELLAALEERPRRWWHWRPAAALAVTALTAFAVVMLRPNAPHRTIMSELKTPVVEAPAAPAVVAEQVTEPRRPPAPVKHEAPPRRMSAQSAEDKITVAAEPKPTFEPPVASLRAKAAAPVPPPPPTPAPMSLLPSENAAPTPVQAGAQLRATSGAISARDLFYAAPAPVRLQAVAEMAVRRTIGLRYTVLRKEGAEFVEADPDTLKLDDIVALRFTANTNGFLSIDGATPIAITAMQPYTTGPIGAAEVKVVFSRMPQTSAEGSVVTERRGRETFVVNTPPATAVTFTITLKRS